MDNKSLLLGVLLGFLLGISPWVGDQVYGFQKGGFMGLTDLILHIFPSLDATWVWATVYWISRGMMFGIPIVLVVLLIIEYRKDKKVNVIVPIVPIKTTAKALKVKLINAEISITFQQKDNVDRKEGTKSKQRYEDAKNKKKVD